jgi:hypothetical protein
MVPSHAILYGIPIADDEPSAQTENSSKSDSINQKHLNFDNFHSGETGLIRNTMAPPKEQKKGMANTLDTFCLYFVLIISLPTIYLSAWIPSRTRCQRRLVTLDLICATAAADIASSSRALADALYFL